MRLTKAAEYGVRCVLVLSLKSEGQVINRREIASEMQIPEQFLSKVAQDLAKAGLIEIVQGSRGGYRMLKPAKHTTLLEVIEAINGNIFLNDCLMASDYCSRSQFCPVHKVWEKARKQLRQTLRETTFDQLAKEEINSYTKLS